MGAGPRKGPVAPDLGMSTLPENAAAVLDAIDVLNGRDVDTSAPPKYGMLNDPSSAQRFDREKEVHDDIKGAIECTEALEKMYAEGTPAQRQCRDIIAKLTRALSNL